MSEHPLESTVTTQLNKPPKGDKEAWVAIVKHRVDIALSERSSWAAEARQALRYYRSDQYRLRKSSNNHRDRIRMVANYVRRDVDQMVASIIDADPVVTTKGRHPRNHITSQIMYQVLEWTRQKEENWSADLEDATQDAFHIGEGVLFEGWNQSADNGQGMPETKWYDSRYVLWDPSAREWQRGDADWIIILEHMKVAKAEAKFDLKDVKAEGVEVFMSPTQVDRYRSRWLGGFANSPNSGTDTDDPKVWVRRMWEKVYTVETRYFIGGDLVQIDGVPMSKEQYEERTGEDEELKKAIRVVQVEIPELWETVIVGDQFVYRKLSPFDKSRGGHGHYPLGFFQLVRLRDESHARGEIGFLIGVSDVRNEVISMALDQAFLANSGFLSIARGSLSPEQMERAERVGIEPFSIIQHTQGTQGPQWQGYNGTGVSIFTGLMPLVDQIQNRESGIYDQDRGERGKAGESGRAIRALQAKAAQLGVMAKKHIESGMQRLALLRLHNIAQFMRGTRIASAVDPDTMKEANIYIGQDAMEVMVVNGLREQQNERGEVEIVDATGTAAKVLILNDEMKRDELLDTVRLVLDTDKAQNRIEREEEAREVIKVGGPAALPWYIEEMDLNNSGRLLEDLVARDQAMQLQTKLEEFAKRGIPPDQVMQMLDGVLQGQGQQVQPTPAVQPA